jgi:hypothetical protein
MIPSDDQIRGLWETHRLPEEKRLHVILVDRVAQFFGRAITEKHRIAVNLSLLHAAALTHDIDKAAQKLPGERHPDACVRILTDAGMKEVARVVAKHPLHAILDPSTRPVTWEEKILFLADKMVKYSIITVDERFRLWREEDLPDDARNILDSCFVPVKQLEKEMCSLAGVSPLAVAKLA